MKLEGRWYSEPAALLECTPTRTTLSYGQELA